jgi:hypothetical protein
MKTPLARRLWTAFRRLPVVAAAGAVLLVALLLVVAPGRAPLAGSLLPVDEAAAELMARPDIAAARLRWMVTPDGRLYRLDLRPDADGRAAALAGFTVELLDGDQRSAAEAAANGALLVDAPDANGLRQSAGRSSSPRRDAPVAPVEAAFFGAAPSSDPALEQAPLVFWFMIASPLDPANGRPGAWPAALGLPDRLGRIVRATPAAAHCLLVEGPAADELRAAIAGRRAGDHLADALGREWSVAARPLLPGEGDPCADPAYLDGPATQAVVRIVDCPEGTPEDTVVALCLQRTMPADSVQWLLRLRFESASRQDVCFAARDSANALPHGL